VSHGGVFIAASLEVKVFQRMIFHGHLVLYMHRVGFFSGLFIFLSEKPVMVWLLENSFLVLYGNFQQDG
jgi:hypothetical protein